MLRAKRLTAQQMAALWVEFYEVYGAEVMYEAYGWSTPTSRAVRPGERAWAFYDDTTDENPATMNHLIGWGTCAMSLSDPDDDEAVLALGVLPQFARRGYRHQILDWLSDWAQKRGARTAKILVYKDNEAQYERTIREAYEFTNPWVHAGDVWFPPPGFGLFIRDLTPEAKEVACSTPESR